MIFAKEVQKLSCVVLTDHARARYKERMGMSKSRMEKDAEQAWKNGVRWDEVSGGLRRYIDSQHFASKMRAEIRIYCGRVYIFKNGALVTVFELPPKYRRKGTEERVRSRRNGGVAVSETVTEGASREEDS